MKHKLLILNPESGGKSRDRLLPFFPFWTIPHHCVYQEIADLTPEDMEDAGCILYTAGELKEQMPFFPFRIL